MGEPGATAVAVVVCPVSCATVALLVSLESQMKQTFATSTSGPPTLLNALPVYVCAPPMSLAKDAGVTSIRVTAGEPNGVPSARVPGENTRPAALVAVLCATKLPPVEPTAASGARVND